LKKEYQTLKEEDQKLEEWIMQMKEKLNSLAEDENYKKYAYVTYDDIKKLTSSNNQ
jgi:protein-arginine kinase activator protein McsA